MAENQLENTRTFRRNLSAADGTGIIEILNCSESFSKYAELANSHYLGKGFYLEAILATVHLPSFQPAPFAKIYPEMSGDQKIAALLEIEENYPFLGLRFHAKKGSGAWSPISTMRLQNKGNRETAYPVVIPYLTVNQLKLLSPDDRLGVSIVNYRHGVLGIGDYINFEGDFRFAVDLIAKPQIKTVGAALPYGIDIGSVAPMKFRTANQNRAILYATNTGNVPVWIAGNDSVAVGSGIYLGPSGGGNLTEQILTSEFWAIAEGGSSRLCGVEASYV
jgi:hypothetical protein